MRKLLVSAALAFSLLAPSNADAAKNDDFAATVAFGEAYTMGNYRLSSGSFDLSYGLGLGVYGGTRLWKKSYYTGFGLGTNFGDAGWYGMVGYEWRLMKVVGMTFEFDGVWTAKGMANAMALIGITVGW